MRRVRSAGRKVRRREREAGSGVGMGEVLKVEFWVVKEAPGTEVPRWLRTALRSVRSMVAAPSKLPEVQ
jgi:hypothetical protein